MSAHTFRPDIEGLRAFAVIAVILFHLNENILPGGYAGVDVFFVISGYLITLSLLNGFKADHGLRRFWGKRIRRILPALLTMVFVTLVLGHMLFYGVGHLPLASEGVGSIFSIANMVFWMQSQSYWADGGQASALLHTWSLSLEEQFYLLYPLLLWVLFKRQALAWWVFVGLFVVSLVGYLYFLGAAPTAAFYLLPFRLWELILGGALGFYVFYKQLPRLKGASWLANLALMGLVIFFTCIGEEGASLLFVPVLLTAILIATGSEHGHAHKLLTHKASVHTGRLSYSLYLWHLPIFVLLHEVYPHMAQTTFAAIALGLTAVLAHASYYMVENPIRYSNKAPYFIMVLFLLNLGALNSLYNGEKYQDTSAFNTPEFDRGTYTNAFVPEDDVHTANKYYGIHFTPTTAAQDQAIETGIIKTYGTPKPEVILWGDSHAVMWAKVVDTIAQENNLSVAFFTFDGEDAFTHVPPKKRRITKILSPEEKLIYDENRLALIDAWQPKVVIVAAQWRNYTADDAKPLLDYLQQKGVRVLLLPTPPELYFTDKNAPQYLLYKGEGPFVELNENAIAKGTKTFETTLKACAVCVAVNITPNYLEGQKALAIEGQDFIYIDSNHLSTVGAMRSKPIIEAALKAALSAK